MWLEHFCIYNMGISQLFFIQKQLNSLIAANSQNKCTYSMLESTTKALLDFCPDVVNVVEPLQPRFR